MTTHAPGIRGAEGALDHARAVLPADLFAAVEPYADRLDLDLIARAYEFSAMAHAGRSATRARTTSSIDYSGYPDCRPEYLRAFERLANLATRAGVEGEGQFHIHAPLLMMNKEQIILRGQALGVDYGITHSCYDPAPDGASCGRCDACALRLGAFARLGQTDPAPYANPSGAGAESRHSSPISTRSSRGLP